MPTRNEVWAYALGFRLQQVNFITEPASPLCSPELVHGIVVRLMIAAENMVSDVSCPSNLSDSLKRMKASCDPLLNASRMGRDENYLCETYEHLNSQMRLLADAIRQSFSEDASRVARQTWLELGMEVVNGIGDDLPSPGSDRRPRMGWQWNDPERLETLLDRVAISRATVFPDRKPEALPSIICDHFPAYWSDWTKLEAGLECLMRTADDSAEDGRVVGNTALSRRYSKAKQKIIDLLTERRHRMTTREILTELEKRVTGSGRGPSEGVTKQALADLVERGALTNRQDCRPNGYGLPEWDSRQ